MVLTSVVLSALLNTSALQVEPLAIRPDVDWIGVSTPSADVIWVSGNKATIARSVDGGKTWQYNTPTKTALEFRDIEALDAQHAYALSVGDGGDSRIYYTNNGGASWQMRMRAAGNQFLNCLAVAPRSNEAWVYGDSIDGSWDLMRSADGRNWIPSRNAITGAPLDGEGGLAASGACVRYNNGIWAMGTANASTARLLIKGEFGIRFRAIDTPIAAGPMAGIASVWPFSEKHVLLAGGDLNNPEREPRLVEMRNSKFTELASPPIAGALYSLSVTDSGGLIVTNPNGAAWLPNTQSTDWQLLSEENIWNSSCAGEYCYLVGKKGFVGKLSLPTAPSRQPND